MSSQSTERIAAVGGEETEHHQSAEREEHPQHVGVDKTS
jgi:hypothetical protein